MKVWTSILALLMAVLLLTGMAAAETGGFVSYGLGSAVGDFTVTTYDGRTVTLSEVLMEKDMVLLHFWNASCGACEEEMPYLQEAYAAYQEQVEVIALTNADADTNEKLATYAERRDLTFPIARDEQGLTLRFLAVTVPTSVVIDRNGQVCYIGSGALSSAEEFARLFDAFVGEGYTTSRVLTSIPSMKPNIPMAAADKLAEALNAPEASLNFTNPMDVYAWPMIPAEEDGRLCLMSTNKGADDMAASVYTVVEAKAGDALRITFKTSTEEVSDLLVLRVNGEIVKTFGGEKTWMTYAHAFAADGVYEIALSYEKDALGAKGGDVVYIDEVALLGGDAAAEALAANPAYPLSGETALTLLNEDARQITFADPTFALVSLFGLADYYIVPGGEAQVLATLAAEVDPEQAFLVNYYDGTESGLVSAMTAQGYRFTTRLDSMESTGFPYTNLSLYPAADCSVIDVRTIVCFASEENANAFVEQMPLYGYSVDGWRYADGEGAATDGLPGEGVEQMADYTLTIIDQQGEFMSGVTLSIRGEDGEKRMTSTEEGTVEFSTTPYAWEVRVVGVPEGCTYDAEAVWTLDAEGGETIIAIEREMADEE